MYLHHTNNLKLQFCEIRSSTSPIKIMAYGGAILVPMAVPLSCLKKGKLRSKIFLFNKHSAKSIKESVNIVLSSLDSKHFLNAIKPSSCGIFGYKPTTSMVHRIMSSGKGGGGGVAVFYITDNITANVYMYIMYICIYIYIYIYIYMYI